MSQNLKSMKQKLTVIAVFLMAILMFGQLKAQVKSDFDKTVDFTKINTYYFEGWAKDSDKVLNDIDKKRITDAFKHELDIRGLKIIDPSEADAAITLYVVIDNKTSTTAYTTYTGGMGYGPGWGWGMHGGMATTSVSEYDYQEGTAVIDFYDTGTKKLIWQGILTTTIKDKPEKREKAIPKNVRKLMKKYPVDPVK